MMEELTRGVSLSFPLLDRIPMDSPYPFDATLF